jgi:trimeric autotransporter adhesin
MGATSLIRHTFVLCSVSLLATAACAQVLVDGNTSETVNLTSIMEFQNISVTATSATQFTVTVSEQSVPNVNWVKACVGSTCATESSTSPVSGTANSVTCPAGPGCMSISLANDLGSQGAGPFNATVTVTGGGSTDVISVVFTPGQSVTSSTPVTPSSLTATVCSGGTATNMVTLTNNTGASFDITQINTTTTDGNPWLSASATPMTGIVAGSTSTIAIVTTAGNLPNGTYSGTVLLFLDSGNPSVSIPVTFTIGTGALSISTQNLGLSYNNGSPQSQSVTICGATAYNAAASTASGGNWLYLTAGSQSGTTVTNVPVATPLTVLVASTVASTLTTGNYSGSITVTDAKNSANTATISVVLSVTIGGATSITVNPASLNFYAQTNSSESVPYQTLVLTAPTGSFSASNTQSWLFLGENSGTIPGVLQASVANLNGLTAGNYSDQITLTAGGVTQNVPVSLTISSGPVANASFTTQSGQSGTVVFTSNGSTATPASQPVTVSASDGSALTLAVTSSPSWLTVTQSGDQLTLTPNVSGLGNAVYSGSVMVTANNTAGTITNSPISIPIILTTSGGPTGSLTFSPTSLTFQSTNGTATPGSQSVGVSATSATNFTITSNSWINVSYSGNLVTPQTLTVSVNPTGLPNGLSSGSINVTAGGVTQSIPVSLTVTGNPATGGTVSASPQSLSFTALVGGAAQNQAVTVSSSGGPTSFTVSTSSSAAWLSATPATASTQSSITVTVNPSGLAAGNYQGTVTISAGNTITIPVTLTVQAPPAISASVSNLSFSYVSGGSAPASQTVTINGSTGGFTAAATTSDNGTWLSVTPASGNAGSTITVSVNPSGLNTGQYTGTITATGTNGLTGQVTISVALTINPPLPSVTAVVNGGSFLSGAVSPGEVITLFGTNLGPAGQTFNAQVASGKLTTTLGGVQVLVNDFPAPLLYVSATQVSAVVPYEIAANAKADIWLSYQGETSNIVTLPIAATAPGILTQNSSGSGAAGYNANFSLNGPNNPAPPGGYVVLYLTGEGQTIPPGVTGTINSTPASNPVPAASISVLIGGQPATYSYAGGVEGVVEGILQMNVQIPANAPSGNLPVTVIIGGNSTQSGVTISVQ